MIGVVVVSDGRGVGVASDEEAGGGGFGCDRVDDTTDDTGGDADGADTVGVLWPDG